MCIYATFKTEMNHKEMEEFKRTWVDDIFSEFGTNDISLSNHIHIVKQRIIGSFESNIGRKISVFGNNRIPLGELVADHGINRSIENENCYYPIFIFYNQLNRFGYNYNDGQPNNIRLRPKEVDLSNGYITITNESILNIIRESFEYVKIFD